MNPGPRFSVIIPTWNRRDDLIACLRSLRAARPGPDVEIIVVDDGSDAGKRPTASGLAPLDATLLFAPHAGPNAARNIGIAHASGEILCFVDDDVLVPTSWFNKVDLAFEGHPTALAIGGRVGLILEKRPARLCDDAELFETVVELGPVPQSTPNLAGCNLVVRREAFSIVGSFAGNIPIYGDETEWLFRLEQAVPSSCIYDPLLEVVQVRHRADLRIDRLIRRVYCRGRNSARNNRRQGEAQERPTDHMSIALRSMAHALSEGCIGGVLSASHHIGRAVGGRAGQQDNGTLEPPT